MGPEASGPDLDFRSANCRNSNNPVLILLAPQSDP